MRLLPAALLGGLVLFAAACQERLATPADCPTLCPGTGLDVFDTVLVAIPGADSTYDGYKSVQDVPSLLVSDELPEREARAFVRFPQRPDTIRVSGNIEPYTIDSIVISLALEGRDPAAKNLRLYFHRIGRALDTLTTFEDVAAQLTAETLVDSLAVPDTSAAGDQLRLLLTGPALDRMLIPPEDSGIVALGFRVAADRPTGIRVGSHISQNGAPTFVTYAHVNVADTSLQKHSLTLPAELANYAVQGGEPPPGDDIHQLGTRRGLRSLLRFTVPEGLRDSVSILRATLELTPTSPLPGLEGDPGSIEVRGIVTDFGAKSPVIPGSAAFFDLSPGAADVQSIDVRNVVALWFLESGPPSALFMRLTPEGGTFSLPEFFSTRAPSGGPRIRVTYARPTRPGHP